MTIDLDKLEELLSEATPGPWEADSFGWVEAFVGGVARQIATASGDAALHGDRRRSPVEIRRANATLIAASRNALPSLIGENRALRARIAELEEYIAGLECIDRRGSYGRRQ